MHMAIAAREWTAAEVQALPADGNRYEVIDGELLVSPSPSWTHQDAVFQLALRLSEYGKANRIAHIIIAPADVVYDSRTMVEPDVFAVPLVGDRKPRTWVEAERLLLAVEVLSPSTARADRTLKRRLYQRQNVPEYWIVDVDGRLVERWRPGGERPELLTEELDWRPSEAHPPLAISLEEYFREVIGE
jgi:Uma2 family endonuclease